MIKLYMLYRSIVNKEKSRMRKFLHHISFCAGTLFIVKVYALEQTYIVDQNINFENIARGVETVHTTNPIYDKRDIDKNKREAVFENILKEIGQLVGKRGRTCFINWARGDDNNKKHKEYNDFSKRLNRHLEYAGVITLFDEKNIGIGEPTFSFMDKISNTMHVISILTPFYKEKSDYTNSGVYYECSRIAERLDKSHLFYIPLVLDGNKDTAIPEPRYYAAIFDILGKKLLNHLRNPGPRTGERVDINDFSDKFKREVFDNNIFNNLPVIIHHNSIDIDKKPLKKRAKRSCKSWFCYTCCYSSSCCE